MYPRLAAALLVAMLLPGAAARAADEPSAFACTFGTGVSHSYEKGQFAAEPASPLAFGVAAIDLAAQTAELKTQRGTGHLRVAQAVSATHFLEVVTEGYLNVTTIYDKDDAKGTYPAVHSRHFGVLGQPVVAQYQGFCEAR
jgi:hypothetical protein